MSNTSPFQQFMAVFFEECGELITDTEQNLDVLRRGEADKETLNAIFRAVHSIKAGAGALNFPQLVEFTHTFEAALDLLRNGSIVCDETVIDLLFQAFDVLVDLVRAAEAEEQVDPAMVAENLSLLKDLMSGSGLSTAKSALATTLQHTAPEGGTWHIVFEPRAEIFRSANEPLRIFRELRALGDLTVDIDTSALPSIMAIDPEDSYFKWRLLLTTLKSEDDIREAFEFVADECNLEITQLAGMAGDDDGWGLFDDPVPAAASLVEEEPQSAVEPQQALAADGENARGSQAKVSSIRVELDRIDRLVNMVGELVITQSMLTQETQDLDPRAFNRLITGMEQLAAQARELQENVMSIRMQPVKSVFQRMPRVVRDLSKKLGKKVELISIGESTEVDKTVIEELVDPLTHMIRNSLDHGIEMPEERTAAGKPATGTIYLRAEHRGGRIIIEIEDDGRGINHARLLQKAMEKGLVERDAKLSNDEILNLIFHPGFSTAEAVTDVSGRGVGMDVVKRNIQSLGGRITVQTEQGRGSRFTLALPLTLAVLDGMIVGIGDHKYVIPVNSIIESIRPREADVRTLVGGSQLLNIRGQYVPLIHIGNALGIANAEQDAWRGIVVIVDTQLGEHVGLVVDALHGQQQVVIKSLESNYQRIEGIAAATILGTGQVCLIIDIDGINGLERRRRGDGGGPSKPQAAAE